MTICEYPAVDMMFFNTLKNMKHGTADRRKSRCIYKDIITAFDIETTGLDDIQHSIMYHWQWAFGKDFLVTGRTWEELRQFMGDLCRGLHDKEYFVVFCHNFSYEFHFLRAILDWENVFSVDKRKVLRAEALGHFEFRCSYLHSNMSLGEYTSKMGAEHKKLDGEEFDYSKKRYPWTPLTEREKQYCYNDVLGLVEALEIEMKADGDNLYSIPLTSTGYVRRECRKAMQSVSQYIVKNALPDIELFRALRQAFRGGNTHANRHFAGELIDDADVVSYDRSSSYPDVQCNCLFPVGSWTYISPVQSSEHYLRDLMGPRHKAVLMHIGFVGLELRDKQWGCPYIARAKCEESTLLHGRYDNGRILSASYVEMYITDVDFKIIESEYKWKFMDLGEMWFCRYGPLPTALTDVIKKLYRDKTELKDVEGQEVYYIKQKNKLNSVYGMSAQNPAKPDILYSTIGFEPKFDDIFKLDIGATWKEELYKEEKRLEEANKKAWFLYAWGVWTTAWARLRLEEGIRMVGRRFVYCDTDSVKYIDSPDITWEEYNKERIRDSIASNSFATDKNGVVHYMGVYEKDKGVPYKKFITFGAKKYAYVDSAGKLHITIAGVDKKKGAQELEKHGGIEALNLDFVFSEAGGTASIYNDHPAITDYIVDGHHIQITPNIYIDNSTYTLGYSDDYEKLLLALESEEGIYLYE